MLRLRGACFRHPDSDWLFRDLDLEVGAGEVVAIVGPSGCGKSTLLRISAGLVALESGRRDCSADSITQVFQTPRLLPWRTALDNVRLPLMLGSAADGRTPPRAATSRSEQLLHAVG